MSLESDTERLVSKLAAVREAAEQAASSASEAKRGDLEAEMEKLVDYVLGQIEVLHKCISMIDSNKDRLR